jgi:hypothetical protein
VIAIEQIRTSAVSIATPSGSSSVLAYCSLDDGR